MIMMTFHLKLIFYSSFKSKIERWVLSWDTGAPPKWPPALSGLADTFDHHSCCLRVPCCRANHTHQSILQLQLGLSGSHIVVQPCIQARLRKWLPGCIRMQMLPTKGTVLEHLTLVNLKETTLRDQPCHIKPPSRPGVLSWSTHM